MYQYSGPGSQQVLDTWGISWETYMASLGYIVVCVDGRGTGGRGEAFEKCTYLKIGVKEAKDQVETALYLGKQPYVDKDRIGIWGWSYGGYMTLMSMSEGTPVFKAGVAVAAPTDWRFYDTIYTERFMRTPKENAEGYKESSAFTRADKLRMGTDCRRSALCIIRLSLYHRPLSSLLQRLGRCTSDCFLWICACWRNILRASANMDAGCHYRLSDLWTID